MTPDAKVEAPVAGKDTLTRRKFTVIEDGAFGRVDPTAFAVYAVICRHASYKTRDNSFPSYATIAAEARCGRSSVRRSIALLIEAKLISVKKTGRIGERRNHYAVLAAPTLAAEGDQVHREPTPLGSQGTYPRFIGNLDQVHSEPVKRDQNERPEREREAKSKTDSLTSSPKKKVKSSRAVETTVFPEGFEASSENQSLAKQRELDISTELKKFRAWHVSRATRCADWQASLTKWLLDSREGKEAPTEADEAAKLLKLAERHRTIIRSRLNSGIPVSRIHFPCQSVPLCPSCQELKQGQAQVLAEDRRTEPAA